MEQVIDDEDLLQLLCQIDAIAVDDREGEEVLPDDVYFFGVIR